MVAEFSWKSKMLRKHWRMYEVFLRMKYKDTEKTPFPSIHLVYNQFLYCDFSERRAIRNRGQYDNQHKNLLNPLKASCPMIDPEFPCKLLSKPLLEISAVISPPPTFYETSISLDRLRLKISKQHRALPI
jgi:hypothetical protein